MRFRTLLHGVVQVKEITVEGDAKVNIARMRHYETSSIVSSKVAV